jgi:hypothetical protein
VREEALPRVLMAFVAAGLTTFLDTFILEPGYSQKQPEIVGAPVKIFLKRTIR